MKFTPEQMTRIKRERDLAIHHLRDLVAKCTGKQPGKTQAPLPADVGAAVTFLREIEAD